MEGYISVYRLLDIGIRQGSVLSPLLFHIFLESEQALIYWNWSFADDIQLAFSFRPLSVQKNFITIIGDLEFVVKYHRAHNLKISTTKTQYITYLLSLYEKFVENNLSIYIENELLHKSNCVKILVIFICKHRFDGHIRLLIQKPYLLLWMLYRTSAILNFNLRTFNDTSHVNLHLHPCLILSIFWCNNKKLYIKNSKWVMSIW